MARDSRQTILQAAARIVGRDGVARLTLDAAAKEAGVSKGGLLYHFPSKEALVAALVDSLVADFDAAFAAAAGKSPGPGSFARAYLSSSTSGEGAAIDAAAAGVVSAVANDPALLEPLRAAYRRWQHALENDGIDPVDATLVRLATDGLWFASLLGLPPLQPDLRQRILERLDSLTRKRVKR